MRKAERNQKRHSYDKEKLIALNEIIKQLEKTGTVSEEYYPRLLKDDYAGTMECHIQSDFLLIWIEKDTQTIKLIKGQQKDY
ncbi:MAG: type II toxin-antitoxin system YafQ family toxin [Bacteroidia bacterium]|nr:type II toxin-antitoxin system YafQ family toxin [Bacteroidia bacterium]